MTLTLYRSNSYSCSVASHIALEESGAVYKTVPLDLSKGEQNKPEHLKLNPKGRVPVLVTDQGVLTETVAILLYIAQTHPTSHLAPVDAFGIARLQGFNAFLASTVHVNHAHKLRGARWSDDAAAIESMKAKVPETMTASAALIESEYLVGPWVMGDHYTVADPYLFINTMWMIGDGVDMTKFPKLSSHHAAMKQRPAVQRVLAQYP
jgi:glutathione S-transferase